MNLVNDFGGENVVYIANFFNRSLQKMDINLVLGYTGYFIGGYYLNKVDLSKRTRGLIYLLGVLGGVSTIGLETLSAIKTQAAIGTYYGYFNVNVLLESLAVYVWFKYNANKVTKYELIIRKVSECSFGIYLVHILIIELLDTKIGLNTLSCNALLSVPGISVLVFGCSLLVSFLITKIPFIHKYVV